MTPLRFAVLLKKHLGPRTRRVWVGDARAHVELRSGDSEELSRVRLELERLAAQRPELHWIDVHQGTGRAVLAFASGSLDTLAAESLVAEAELRARMEGAAFGSFVHPADPEPAERLFIQLVFDVASLALATSLKFSIFPRSGLMGALSSALALVQSNARLRRLVDERLGAESAEVLLSLAIASLDVLAQRPLEGLVGAIERVHLLRELEARSRLFHAREARFFQAPGSARPRSVPTRPVPLPRGPIEEYSDRSWAVALGGFLVSLLSTRSVQRSFGSLFGAVPRPARLGREVFGARFGRHLAARSVLVLDPDALRRLDRVDCLVIQGDLALGGTATIASILVVSEDDYEEIDDVVHDLFGADAPLSIREASSYRLLPMRVSTLPLPEELARAARRIETAGDLPLCLEHTGRIVALVEVRVRSRIGLEELIQAAHHASMRVVLASDDPDVLGAVPADDTLAGGDELWRGVRALQREGRVVCVVTQGDQRALDVADVGVALIKDGAEVPWSAHIVADDDLSEVRLLIEAASVARMVSRQSVNIALGAASLGALASVIGILPMTTARVMTIVNVASLVSMANGYRLTSSFIRRPLLPARDPTPWHALDASGVMQRLGTSPDGLSTRLVALRTVREEGGRSAPSELATAIGDELFSPLVPLLAAGAGLSAVAGSFADAAMVGGVVGANAVVGGVQRFRTERAIARLSRSSAIRVLVRRDGRTEEILSDALVRGDVVLLAGGDLVPADARIIEARGLEVDASGLTGESLPVKKHAAPSFEEVIADRTSMLYAGTTITTGQATAVVVATGANTEARRGAATFRQLPRDAGVERRMRQLMDLTAPVALAAAGGVIGLGLLRGRRLDQLAGSAVSLAVAAVPEGLPLLATAAQLAAARRLSRRGALVRNARAIEALGRVDTVCLDKTGTMTEGSVELALVSDARRRYDEWPEFAAARSVVLAALLASPVESSDPRRSDPIDAALFRARALALAGEAPQIFERIRDLSFTTDRGYHAVFHRRGDSEKLFVKGIPETIAQRLASDSLGEPWSEEQTRSLLGEVKALSEMGLRVLAVAQRDLPPGSPREDGEVGELRLVGLLAFRDPVRPTTRDAIFDLRKAGLRPVMITGDHPSTARVVAEQAGLSAEPVVMTGAEIAALDEADLTELGKNVDVFARVSPSQKVRVVRALSRAGRTVLMVGDGANDAAAIRLASVGVALGEHSAEAARQAADMVLIDPRLGTLVRAIAEGRAVWESVRDAVSVLVGGNLGEIGFTLLGGLVTGRPPLSPRQLLLVNLFTDVAPATALALRRPTIADLRELTDAGPEASMGWRLNRDIGARALATGSGAAVAYATASLIGGRRGASTTALLALVGTQLAQTLRSGQRTPQVVVTSVVSAFGLATIVQTPGLSGAFGCRPLGPLGWSIAIGSSVVAASAGRALPDLLEQYFGSRSAQNLLAT